jgi:hypothetical protein
MVVPQTLMAAAPSTLSKPPANALTLNLDRDVAIQLGMAGAVHVAHAA